MKLIRIGQIAINPQHVMALRPDPDHDTTCKLILTGGTEVNVTDSWESVLAKFDFVAESDEQE